jgi:hypothetical protein
MLGSSSQIRFPIRVGRLEHQNKSRNHQPVVLPTGNVDYQLAVGSEGLLNFSNKWMVCEDKPRRFWFYHVLSI